MAGLDQAFRSGFCTTNALAAEKPSSLFNGGNQEICGSEILFQIVGKMTEKIEEHQLGKLRRCLTTSCMKQC